MADTGWRVSVPLDELISLVNFQKEMKEIHDENAQLRRELEGLRTMFTELQIQFGDVKKGYIR